MTNSHLNPPPLPFSLDFPPQHQHRPQPLPHPLPYQIPCHPTEAETGDTSENIVQITARKSQ